MDYGREQFEMYCRNQGGRDFEETSEGGIRRYVNPYTEGRWIYWQASRDALNVTTVELCPTHLGGYSKNCDDCKRDIDALTDWDEEFEQWWQRHGQYGRAGGGHYEKTFAFNAWKAALEVKP